MCKWKKFVLQKKTRLFFKVIYQYFKMSFLWWPNHHHPFYLSRNVIIFFFIYSNFYINVILKLSIKKEKCWWCTMDEWKKKSSSNSIRFFSSSSSTFDNRWSMFWKIISFSSLFFLSLPFFDDAWHIFLLLLLSMIDEKKKWDKILCFP